MVSPSDGKMKDSPFRLLLHQAALLDTVFHPSSKRVILLRGEVGLGKGMALAALASRMLRKGKTTRVLVLLPGSVKVAFEEMLQEAGAPTLAIDRYLFRELLDSPTGPPLWPAGFVVILSRELARKEDVRAALATARWDLLIVDEADHFKGGLAGELLRLTVDVSDRVVLSGSPDLELPIAVREDGVTVVDWRRDQVVNLDGTLLDNIPRPIFHMSSFSLTPAEIDLAANVEKLSKVFKDGTSQGFLARSLRSSFQSSPAALEGTLARLKTNKDQLAPIQSLLETSEEEAIEDQHGEFQDSPFSEHVAGQVAEALEALDAAGNDSKLAAFVAILNHIDAVKTSLTRVCVLTNYLGTLFYLAAEIESLEKTCYVFHGGMSTENRHETLDMFSREGGILTATRATMFWGEALREVTDLILYDLPGTPSALHQVLGRFDQFGRKAQLNVYTLLPPDSQFHATFDQLLDDLQMRSGPPVSDERPNTERNGAPGGEP